jgi:thiamine phosphate synthase YjbQ (UPF0047 family)
VRTASIIIPDFTRQYIPEDNSEHHTRRRENLKSHMKTSVVAGEIKKITTARSGVNISLLQQF